MKKIIFIITLLIAGLSYAQDFEGVVHYKRTFTIIDNRISIDQLEKDYGKKSTVYIKNGYYKSIDDSDFMTMQLYRYTDQKMYFFNKNTDTLFYLSTNFREKNKYEFHLKKQTDTILGVVCDRLEVKINANLTYIYYFSSKYSLDPEFYKNYTLINKNEILNRMKSIYLKFTGISKDYILTSEAVKIELKKLDESIFDIPKHKILIEKKI